jgi:membrane fusion protein, multidrug efflux system
MALGPGMALAFVLAGCGAPGAKGPPNMGPPVVSVITVASEPVTLTADLPGRTTPYETSDVRPQVNGIIQSRLFKEGSNVHAGQLLYQIDPAPYRAAYDQAVAQLASARASLVTAKLKAERYADMVKINAVSHQDADDAQSIYGQDAAAVQQQAASVESARINLGYTKVTAPIGGRIGPSSFTPGALVTNGQANALATIQRLDPIYVDVTQTAVEHVKLESELEKIAAGGRVAGGATVHVQITDGLDYPIDGHFQFTDVTVDQNTGSVTLRAVFPNPNGMLLPGMYVRARIIEGVDPAGILVPQQAVTRDEKGRPTAMVVDAQGHAQPRMLELGAAFGNRWRVTSGLKPGDRLIVEGGDSAKPGAPVHAIPYAPKPAAVSAGVNG